MRHDPDTRQHVARKQLRRLKAPLAVIGPTPQKTVMNLQEGRNTAKYRAIYSLKEQDHERLGCLLRFAN